MVLRGRMTRIGAGMLLLLGLGACDTTAGVLMATAGIVSFVHTEKTLTDHAVSYVTKENCTLLHTANNEPYCQEPDDGTSQAETEADAMMAQAYCYRTLGAISCYREPDPMASAQARVNW